MQTRDVVEDLHNLREFLLASRMFRWGYLNTEKVFYCSYKMILNTTSKAGESSLIATTDRNCFCTKSSHFAWNFSPRKTILQNLTGEFSLPAGRSESVKWKTVRPKAAFSGPRSQFFTLRTDPMPENDMFIFSCSKMEVVYFLLWMVFCMFKSISFTRPISRIFWLAFDPAM